MHISRRTRSRGLPGLLRIRFGSGKPYVGSDATDTLRDQEGFSQVLSRLGLAGRFPRIAIGKNALAALEAGKAVQRLQICWAWFYWANLLGAGLLHATPRPGSELMFRRAGFPGVGALGSQGIRLPRLVFALRAL